jgi:hypothetical protein
MKSRLQLLYTLTTKRQPRKKMKGSLYHEYDETGIPAEEVWPVYGTLLVGQLLHQLLPHLFKSVELVEGDGGVGTVLRINFSPGSFFVLVIFRPTSKKNVFYFRKFHRRHD